MKRFTHLLVLLLLAVVIDIKPVAAQRVDQSAQFAPATPKGGAAAEMMNQRIAAIVNDNVISTFDIESRAHLAMLSAGLPDTEEIRQRLLPQILRGLLDEQLQLQEAKRLDISISKEDIDAALNHIAQDNHIPGGDMRSFLAEHGISPTTLVNQVRASLAWNKVVQRELRPHVDVGDDEIDSVLSRIKANAGKEEYLVSEIFLAVDSPNDEDQVHQFAENLTQQIKNHGNFAAAARQFSQGTGAATGGDIGWIQEGQLQPDLDQAISKAQAGDVVGPIRSSSGYHILGIREKRIIAIGDPKDLTLNLQQAFRPLETGSNPNVLLQDAERLRNTISGCDHLESLAVPFPHWRGQKMGDVKMSKLPSWILDKVRDVPVGKASAPISTDKGVLLLIVCNRKNSEDTISREAIMNTLGTEKLELQARRLLRDLRRSAYIDIRLGQQQQ